jgi:uncharacterized protein YqeY
LLFISPIPLNEITKTGKAHLIDAGEILVIQDYKPKKMVYHTVQQLIETAIQEKVYNPFLKSISRI